MLDARGAAVPTVVHWGADLGALTTTQLARLSDDSIPPVGPSATDSPTRPGLIPLLADGWTGQPGLEGRHHPADAPLGRPRRPTLTLVGLESEPPVSACVVLEDSGDGARVLAVTIDIKLTPDGVLRVRTTVTNLASAVFELTRAAISLPLPDAAREHLDFCGTWAHERQPQRAPVRQGTWLRESRHGRGGHDDSFLLAAGTPSFGFRSGEVWAFHLATSGDTRVWLERTATGHTIVGLAELLATGEVVLNEGESYVSPWSMAAWSDRGLDGVAQRFHRWFRSLPAHPAGPRPLTLNTWEAVYFDHDENRIFALADAAASIGVERFVLDDGWMTGRSDDSRALGDWTVDPVTWPRGLRPLIAHVTAAGMQFGLWVEPEMVSLDSDLAREHPEWILREHTEHLPRSWRHQQTLDLGNVAVRDFIVDALSALLDEYDIAYLKWDMNRDLLGGSTHRHVAGLYEIIDRLRRRFPAVEIESCSSGGARIDAGILERVQRVWPSDTNDPLERLAIERWTSLLVPPEYLGSHVGAGTAHTTGRSHSLEFRLAGALFGHAGIEWDLTILSESDRATLARWAATYAGLRSLLHSGTVVNADTADHRFVRGIVSSDGLEGVFCIAALDTSPTSMPTPERILGLDPDVEYRVRVVTLADDAPSYGSAPPAWMIRGETRATGRALATVGLMVPSLKPEQAIVVRCSAVSPEEAQQSLFGREAQVEDLA